MPITVEQTRPGTWTVDHSNGVREHFDDRQAALRAAETVARLERRGYVLIEHRPEWLRGH